MNIAVVQAHDGGQPLHVTLVQYSYNGIDIASLHIAFARMGSVHLMSMHVKALDIVQTHRYQTHTMRGP